MAEPVSSEVIISPGNSRKLKSNYEHSQCPTFVYLPELSSEKIGGKVLYSTDNQEDAALNLLKSCDPVWNDNALSLDKHLDGWETSSLSSQSCQWCIIQLGIPGVVYGIDVDTAYFIGHHPLRMSVQVAKLSTENSPKTSKKTSKEERKRLSEWAASKDWDELVPAQPLQPGYQTSCHNYFKISNRNSWTHLRFSIFPGGGVARLRVYGQPAADLSCTPNDSLTDLLLLQNGGVCVCSSCPKMIQLASTLNYDDQSTTSDNTCTRPGENHLLPIFDLEKLKDTAVDVFWAVYRLGHPGIIKKIKIQTGKFDCQYLSFCQLEACLINRKQNFEDNGFEDKADLYPWQTLLPLTGLLPCTQSVFEITPPRHGGVITHIRLSLSLSAPNPVKHKLLSATLKRLHIHGYKCIPSFPKL